MTVTVRTVKIPIEIEIIGCPLTVPMFSPGTAQIVRFSKMSTNSDKKVRQLKVHNPTSVPLSLSWKLYFAKDIYDIPKVEVHGQSAFINRDNPDEEVVQVVIIDTPGRQVIPKDLVKIIPESQEIPTGGDAKFEIVVNPKTVNESLNVDIQCIGYVSILRKEDKISNDFMRHDEYKAESLKINCLAPIEKFWKKMNSKLI